MKKKIIIISIIAILIIGGIGYGVYRYISKGTVVCTKNLLTQDYHTVDLRLDILFNKEQIADYTAKTLYTIKSREKYEELISLLPNCVDLYSSNETIECIIEEKEVVRRHTLSRDYKEYMEDLEDQGFTCSKTYNGF